MVFTHPFVRGLILVAFFSGITFFVACKAGLIGEEKKSTKIERMGGTKSAVIIESDTTPLRVIPSTKSGRIIEPIKPADSPKTNIDMNEINIIHSTKSGRIIEPIKPVDTTKPK